VSLPKTAPHLSSGVVFDGDDTLWSTEHLYDDARKEAREIVAAAGLDPALWEQIERRIDVENVAKLGYGTERFPVSCVQAYEEVCRSEGKTVDARIGDRVRRAACTVFERDPPLVPGARETLRGLRERGVRLALLTKGDRRLQQRRIDRSGLHGFFDAIRVVPEKSPDEIRAIVAVLGLEVESVWMVGNSIRSDVLPAVAAGLRAAWINAHVWEYERACDHLIDDRVITLSNLGELSSLIDG
jgi:putative hydrolase of the HAD superfamily